MMRDDIVQEIGERLNSLILSELREAANEQRYPGQDPDKMDDTICEALSNAAKLRKIREVFENIVTKVIIRK
jgi:hypothetical protein